MSNNDSSSISYSEMMEEEVPSSSYDSLQVREEQEWEDMLNFPDSLHVYRPGYTSSSSISCVDSSEEVLSYPEFGLPKRSTTGFVGYSWTTVRGKRLVIPELGSVWVYDGHTFPEMEAPKRGGRYRVMKLDKVGGTIGYMPADEKPFFLFGMPKLKYYCTPEEWNRLFFYLSDAE